jgi:hypothetical protein
VDDCRKIAFSLMRESWRERQNGAFNRMKVTGKPVRASVGVWFVGFALIMAILLLPGAKNSASPVLYVCIFGGLFVGVPAVLGVGVLYHNLHTGRHSHNAKRR